MLYLDFIDAHEGTGEALKYLDENLATFLAEMNDNGAFGDDTAIMLFSDHGLHMNGVYS